MAVIAMLLLLVLAPEASAQKVDTNQFVMTRVLEEQAWARRPIFGIDTNDFWYGGVFATRQTGYPSGGVGNLWPVARWLGLKIIERRTGFDSAGYVLYDGLIDGADPDSNERVIVNGGMVTNVGWAREIILYPFDSSQSLYWNSIFRLPEFGSRPGITDSNSTERDHRGDRAQERIYDTTNTTAGATVLQRVAYGYDSVFHLRRYPNGPYDENVENSSAILVRNDVTARAAGLGGELRSRYFAVQGHLFEFGAAQSTDTLLLIDIYNEIPKGTHYLNASGNVDSNMTQDLEILYTTLAVRKADLMPIAPDNNYNLYVEKTFNVDLVRLQPTSGMGGPLHPDNTAHRFDIRVRWTGKEKVAIRSIHLRDSIGELLLGKDPSLNSLRNALRVTLQNEVDRIMRGVNYQQDTTNTNAVRNARMQKILRFYTGDEGLHMMTGITVLDSFLYRRYPNLTLDTLTRGMRAFRAQPGSQGYGAEMLHGTSVSENEIAVELYPFEGTEHKDYDSSYAKRFGLPYHIPRTPSISEHNGGRFGIPLLNLSGSNARDSVNISTLAMQRQSFGGYAPGGYAIWPHLTGINNIGHAASVARRSGRRLIIWPGVMANLRVFWEQTGTNQYEFRDTLFSHLPEPADERMIVNIGLCYGASGIHLSWIGSDTNEFEFEYKHLGGDTVLYNYQSDLGLIGQFTGDTTSNVLSPYVLGTTRSLAPHRIEIPNFWTGWQVRSKEMRWLTTSWIPNLWSTLKRLRWRDGYSIHLTALQSWFDPPTNDLDSLVTRQRSIKAGEVVSDVKAYGRDDTLAFTRLDPAINTFVEIGLFDKLTGTTGGVADPDKDTTHIMVVNRRTFERSEDIDSTSTRGKTMDSLAEWRRVLVRLNIPRRDSVRYTFVRVREVFPDQTPLPFSGDLRQGLDTAVANDSAVALLMRPGSGTLLEITYLKPDGDLDGILAFNNSRKILFDGTRYYATYARFEPDSNYITSVNDNIYFRWSNPVASTEDPILWSAMEYVVSNPQVAGDTRRLENRTPSITLRTVNGDTIVTVVWSAHSINTDSAAANKREVVARDMVVVDPDGGGPHVDAGPIQLIAYHYGSNSGLYGTPVVARLEGSDAFSWSDSAKGIGARLRKRPFVSTWWHDSGNLGVTNYFTAWTNSPKNTARFPTMPPFSRIDGNDSTIALAWQQSPATTSPVGFHDIWYVRLEHLPGTPAPFLYANNKHIINSKPGFISHPSIDQWQCWWGGIYEGIVYEDNDIVFPGIVYRPLHSDWVPAYGGGTEMQTWRWTPLKIRFSVDPYFCGRVGFSWPSIASLNEVIDNETGDDTTFFAVAYEDSSYVSCDTSNQFHFMREAQIWFGNSVLRNGYPKRFQYNGYFPHTAASPVRQDLHSATLYQAKSGLIGTPIPARTTRQFFGKARPTGYIAQGREATIRIDDTNATTISLELNDIWIANDSTAQGLAFVDRGSPSDTLDTLSQLNNVLRTDYFHAHDSTTIGCIVAARFVGDSALADTFWVDAVVELVDSANPSTGAIVLDSFRVSAQLDSHLVIAEPTLDLLSGTYQIRMRLTTNVPPPATDDGESVYPIGDIVTPVDNPPGAGKIRRTERSGGARARLSVQPNPVADYTEIRFSVPTAGLVAVRVINQRGEEVAVPVAATAMEIGRYAVGLDTRRMMPGVYVIELQAGKDHVVEKVVITH